MRLLGILLLIGLINARCTINRTTFVDNATINDTSDTGDSTLTIFLLERDIPIEIRRLGIVTIPVGASAVDQNVKKQLRLKCKEIGANGAYRIADGFYPSIGSIPYLVFKYKK